MNTMRQDSMRFLFFFFRVLDPLLYDLLDPALHRLPSVAKANGKELQDFEYERPIDQSYLKYVLETLLSVVRFGGQGFGKTARTTPVRKCHHPGVLERVEACMSINSSSWGRILIMRSSRLESRCHLSRRSRRCFDTVRAGTRADNH